ncbi:hypothetical protein JMJ78_0000967 [Colletotrichum scovillei]|nr:hypothetical protein JMJ78_0000967 [Colletotrichum scovillei]
MGIASNADSFNASTLSAPTRLIQSTWIVSTARLKVISESSVAPLQYFCRLCHSVGQQLPQKGRSSLEKKQNPYFCPKTNKLSRKTFGT